MSTVTKIYIEDMPFAKRSCSRHRAQRAMALIQTSFKAPYGGSDIVRTTYACPSCVVRARSRQNKLVS